MTKLHIAKNFTLPSDAVAETFAILGIRGSGKTNTAVVIAEELLKSGQQVVIIDPVDVWWGLKSSKDGKTPGFPIPVIGGEHADVPLDGAAGQVLADFVTETRASVIFSLRHLSMNDQRRFAGDFAKHIYERKGRPEYRSPMMLMVDEADEFVPQRLPHGHEAMFGAFDRLVRRGRSSGIGVTLISQRAQVINKDVLSQMGTLVAMRVLHKLDRKAMEAWIEAHDTEGRQEEFMGSLASLERGDAWVWSPSWLGAFERIHVRARETFDSSGTPKAGEKIAAPKEIAPVDLDKLRAQMGAQIERAKADDPKALRARIAELEREAKKKTPAPAAAPPAKVQRVEVAVLKDSQLKRLESAAEKMKRAAAAVVEVGQEIQGVLFKLIADQERRDNPPPPPNPRIIRPPAARALPPPRPPAPRQRTDGDGNLGGAQRVLKVLAQRHPLRVTRRQLATLAGLAPTGGTFSTYYSRLRTAGYLDESGGLIGCSEAGLAGADVVPSQPQTTEELVAMWRSNVGGAGRMLDVLVDAYPRALDRETLAAHLEMAPTGGTFSTYLSRLRSNGLAEVIGREVRASGSLFDLG